MSKLHLRVFEDKSELVYPDGRVDSFPEGPSNAQARSRYQVISDSLAKGYLSDVIELCKQNSDSLSFLTLGSDQLDYIDYLVDAVTSEVGRALIGIVVLQLCVKDISPLQNIRLHKAGKSNSAFSWQDGISMRTLDASYITPTLRKYDLVRLNADGFMMTRSLAENYPYSRVYKANMRGARDQWLHIVEDLEADRLNARSALLYLISKLLNKASDFKKISNQMLGMVAYLTSTSQINTKHTIAVLLKRHMSLSDYAARIMEIAMHSLMQAMQEHDMMDDCTLVPLSQMRSANKKHGNIGDIEIKYGSQIVQAWDAKYGISYLRDEVEELAEKLQNHPDVREAGFVTSLPPDRSEELSKRMVDISEAYGVALDILTFDEWVAKQFDSVSQNGSLSESQLAVAWITAYAESLAQQRPTIAPIDEPCYQWVESLLQVLMNISA